jgi:hypothetical protein
MIYNPFVKPSSKFSSKQLAEIKRKAKDIFDKVYSFDEMDDQIDVIGSRGGDICHFRFYNDGTVVEK